MYSAHIRRIASAPDVKNVAIVPDEQTFFSQFLNFNRRQRRYHTSYPIIRGKAVNLYALFSSVVKHGGYSKVTEKNHWEAIARDIGCPSACTNYSVALRRIYCQYLVAFENETFPHLKTTSFWLQLQEEFNENPGDMYVPPSVEKMLGICNPKPASFHSGLQRSGFSMSITGRDFYRSNQDVRFASSFDQLTPAQQLEELHSRPHPANMYDLRHVTTLEIAERSLMSGLPNEIDLSLNSILFLSAVVQHSPSTPLRFSSCRNLLQLMLATVGIYEDGPGSLRPMNETWHRASNLDFDEFWRNAVGDWVLSFLHNDAYLYEEHSEPLVQDAETAGYRVVPPPSPETTQDLFSPSSLDNTRTLFGRNSSGDHCLSTNAALSRVLMVVATLVNSVTPPYLANMPPPLEEDDDEIELMMSFASVQSRRALISGGAIHSGDMVGGRLFRGRSLYPATYLPPLSSWRDNTRFLSSNLSALRFAFLCAYARHSTLRQLGLQLISSLRYPLVPNALSSGALQKVPSPLHDNTFTGIELISVRFLVRCLIQSDDRCDLLAGLNLLTNLLRVPEGINVERLFAGLPRSLWCRLIQLLCLSDLGLVCAVLEVLHTATGMGGVACARLWSALASADDTVSPLAPSTVFAPRRASSHLRPLLALLSLEGQAMGPGSLHRVKVVPRYPPPQSQQQYHHHPRYQYHPSPHLVTSRSPYPALPPHQNCQQQHQQQPIIRPPLPPPSNPHSMTPPSATSVSQSPSSLASLLSPGNGSPTASASPRSGPTMSLPVPPQLANVRPKPSSLSELTDRLVMPPPKEPPPRRQSSRVNGAAAGGSISSPPCRLPLVNGKIHNNPPPSSVSNHRLPSRYHLHQISSAELQQQKTAIPSKSLLEEVLNNPSEKALQSPSPPLVNGWVSQTSGGTIHHTGTRKGVDVDSDLLSMKMFNGEAGNVSSLPVMKSKDSAKHSPLLRVNKKHEPSPLMVNGVFHERPGLIKNPKTLKSLKKEQADCNEDGEEDDEASTEARLIESATLFAHQLRYNRNVGFYYTRKRPRNFAMRNRVFDTPPSASFSVKRRKMMDGKSERRAAMLTVEQGKVPSIQQPPPPPPPMFVCEWSGCFRQFSEASQVYGHVYSSHLKPFLPPPNAFKTSLRHPLERKCCQWNDCPTAHVPRAPYSLQSHVLDFHCSAVELESRRRLMPLRGDFDAASSAPAQQQPVQICFPPDQSGWAIIRDVETRRLQSDLWVSQYAISGGRYLVPPVAAPRNILMNQPLREGPVTKHLRVTAALILRNLAKYVPEARQWLSSETQLLCEIAMGTCPGASSLRSNDAGHIIAQCLFLCSSSTPSSDPSFHLVPRRIIGGSGDHLDEIDTYCSFGLSDTDDEIYEHFYDDDLDATDSRLAVLQRLAFLRQRSTVDLDA